MLLLNCAVCDSKKLKFIKQQEAKVELDLSNYATKADVKNAIGVDISKVAQKFDLANLKSNVDKLDVEKLKNIPSGLNSLKSKVDK